MFNRAEKISQFLYSSVMRVFQFERNFNEEIDGKILTEKISFFSFKVYKSIAKTYDSF